MAANGSVSSPSINCSHSKLNPLAEGSKEYIWGCELTAENPAVTWTFEEEDDDKEFMNHTLFLRQAVLGAGVKPERHIVQVETKDQNGEDLKVPLGSLTLGVNDMCYFDLNFGHEIPVTFRLVAGSGPLHLAAQLLVEFPPDQLPYDDDDECSDGVETEADDSLVKEPKSKKRKGTSAKGRLDSSAENGSEEDDLEDEEDDDEDEDEDEDMDEDEEEDDEEESPSPKKKSKKSEKGGKAEPVKGKKGVKSVSKSKDKKAPAKKIQRKSKAK